MNRDIAINSAEDLSDNKIGDKKNLLTNFIFLKIVINKMYTSSANTQQLNIISAIYGKKKEIFLPYI